MHKRKLVLMLVGTALVAALMALPAGAAPSLQGSGLQDPQFDLAAKGVWKWQTWSYQAELMMPGSKKDVDLEHSFYAPTFMASESKWDHGSAGLSGSAGAVSGRVYSKFRGGFYQVVDVGQGARVRFSIWANELCQSGGSQCSVLLRAGIDPTGGADWSSGNVKWAGVEVSKNRYVQLVTEEVVAGSSGKVTVFTWGEPTSNGDYSAAYFDDASLIIGGAGAAGAPAGAAANPTPAPAGSVGCAQLRWVSDVTIPDGTAMAPGAAFVKTWRVKNNGTCTFSGTLNFIGKGNQMGGTSPATLAKIEAGQQADVNVNLTAPAQAGDYQGTWQPRADDGTQMENLVVRIKVSASAPTPTPTVTTTVTATVQTAPTATAMPVPTTSQICIQAFGDTNGDGQQNTDEALLAGVVYTLYDARGAKETYTTDGVGEPYCFKSLPAGTYPLAVKPPTGFASTTYNTMTVSLGGGMKADVAFGARRTGPAPAATRAGDASKASTSGGGLLGSTGRLLPILLVVLALVILGGAGWFLLSRSH